MDWPGLLRFALQMGIAPSAFWSLSVREWSAMVQRNTAGLALDGLNRLEREFEDVEKRNRDERRRDE